MKIDYMKLIKESAQFTWKYKVLWIFGFILSLFSGGSGSSNGSSYNTSGSSDSATSNEIDRAVEQVGDSISDIVNSPYFWIGLIVVIVLFVLLMIVSWYLKRVSKIALMNSVKYDEEGKEEKISFASLWKGSHPYLMKFFVYDLFWFVICAPFVLILVVLAFVGILLTSQVIGAMVFIAMFCCLLIPLIFVFIVLITGVKETGERLILFDNFQPFEAIKKSWHIFSSFFSKYVLAWLVMLLPGCGFGIVTSIVSLVTILPLLFVVIPLFLNSDTYLVGLGIGGCGICFMVLILALIQSPFIVFQNTYWTKFLMKLFKEGKVSRVGVTKG